MMAAHRPTKIAADGFDRLAQEERSARIWKRVWVLGIMAATPFVIWWIESWGKK